MSSLPILGRGIFRFLFVFADAIYVQSTFFSVMSRYFLD